MSEEIEILEYIYQYSKICQETIMRIIKTRNKKDILEEIIKKQYYEYKKISNSAKSMLQRRGKNVSEEIGIMGKIMTYMEIKKNVNENDSINEVAILLIEGSKIGIEQIKKHTEDIKFNNKYILNLINRLIIMEENNIKELEKYI